MTGPTRRVSIAPSDAALAGLAVLVVLGLGLFGASRSRAVALERRAASDVEVAANARRDVALAIERSLRTASEDALLSGIPSAQLPSGFVPVVAGATPSRSALSVTAASYADLVAVLDRARDSGEAVLGRPVDLGEGLQPVAVAAAFGTGGAQPLPQSTLERRARITGWIVRPIDLGAVIAGAIPADHVATVTNGSLVTDVGAEPAPDRLPLLPLEVSGERYEIRAGNPDRVPFARSTVAMVAATALVAALSAYAMVEARRRLRRQQQHAADRASQIALIGEVGPLVQQSLELADVLPGIAVQLSDHFDLAGVSLSTFVGSGRVDLFSFGEPSSEQTKPVLRPPEHIDAGETLVLALERGGRSVAQLRLVPRRALDGSELQSLRAITELITAAVANASLYASQQEALHRLRDLDALKTGFLGTASHELRTPVTAIAGFASLLEDNWDRFDDEQRRHFVQRIGSNARSLGAVVQDLLDFSLLDRGTIQLSLEEVDLAVVAQAVVERLGPVFGDHEIALTAAPAPRIAADSNGLERVISNLLTNAVKFSPAGTTVSVAVGESTVGTYAVELTVCDEGPGIPADERAHVFTRFFRGSGEAVLRTRGVGIGLSVVAEIVELLHGTVEVGEAPGGGARFTLRFPAADLRPETKEAAHAPAT